MEGLTRMHNGRLRSLNPPIHLENKNIWNYFKILKLRGRIGSKKIVSQPEFKLQLRSTIHLVQGKKESHLRNINMMVLNQ